MLISAPSDIEDRDIAAVYAAIRRWNVLYGASFASVIVPMHWGEHASSLHGQRPQSTLNQQLVDETDIVLAVFWYRLGSSTGEAVSGTVEELSRAADADKQVAILRCARDVPHDAPLDQQMALRSFLDEMYPKSLILEYLNEHELGRHVDTIATRATTSVYATSRATITGSTGVPGARIVPRIESRQNLTDGASAFLERQWDLVISNVGSEAAWDVNYQLFAVQPGDEPPVEALERRGIRILNPGAEVRLPLLMHPAVPHEVGASVSWNSANGLESDETTVRIY